MYLIYDETGRPSLTPKGRHRGFKSLLRACNDAQRLANKSDSPILLRHANGVQSRDIQVMAHPEDDDLHLASLGLVTAVRDMTDAELDLACGMDGNEVPGDVWLRWTQRPLVIQFESGHQLYAMADEEGNQGGVLWSVDARTKEPGHPLDATDLRMLPGGSYRWYRTIGRFDETILHFFSDAINLSVFMVAMRDHEGNGHGTFVVTDPVKKQSFYI